MYGSTTPSPTSSPTVVIEDEDDDIRVTTESPTMWTLLKEPDAVQFFTYMTMMGFAIAVIQAFLFLYFENDLHGTSAMVGLFGPLGSSTEVVVFFFSKEIHQRLGSRRMLIVAQSIATYRFLTYMVAPYFTHGAWLVTITQLLHGVGFSMTWSAGALQADRIAPIGLKSSAQGLLNMAFNGVGSGLGALIGGIVYEKYGGRAMWGTAAVLALSSIFVFTSTLLRNTLFTSISRLVQKYLDIRRD
ncbi:unnamed protein product [Mucor hiemalis]